MIVEGSSGGGNWSGVGAPRRNPWRFRWSELLWLLVYPQGGQRILPTVSGTILIVLSFGIGSAAYNTANNILFITLSLMFACLILSGVLSWLNFRGVRWRVLLAPPFRVGQPAAVTIELANDKQFLPSCGLWFDLAVTPVPPGPAKTSTGRPAKETRSVREILAAVGQGRIAGRQFLRGTLLPSGEARLEWNFLPARRGRHRFTLEGIGSLFPFGFLRKQLSSGMRHELVIWPAPVAYRSWGAAAARPRPAGVQVARPGQSGDLLALRRYQSGDSHRLIHWKASARMQELLVRQFAAESHDTFLVWVRTPAEVWTRSEQFERMLGFAATLTEDLFRAEKLRGVALNDEPAQPVNRLRDLEAFLDRLAVAQVVAVPEVPRAVATGSNPGFPDTSRNTPVRRNLLTFAPDGLNGIGAYADGKKTASA